jgi:hypothetical protein
VFANSGLHADAVGLGAKVICFVSQKNNKFYGAIITRKASAGWSRLT